MPSFVFDKRPAIIRPICLTDEYAINDLRSDCRRQIKDVSVPPISAIDISGDMSLIFIVGNDRIIRANPYPPNFRRIAANTIEPATGASTCAFGSHKWTRNSGSFTIKAIIDISHRIEVP
jgi:hypothetical protein